MRFWMMFSILFLPTAMALGNEIYVSEDTASFFEEYPAELVAMLESTGQARDLFRPVPYKSSFQKLSVPQMASLTGGALLGMALFRRVFVQAMRLDSAPFTLIGVIVGSAMGGQWCNSGFWPC
ncbi:exported hypothetical protein [Gammaproteobacteria bacterium]